MMSFHSNPQADSNPETLSHLDWLAFCYLADEFEAAERESFEKNLASDQAYREALARAVELSCAVTAGYAAEKSGFENQVAAKQVVDSQVVDSQVVVRPAEHWVRAATWFTIATAASLALVVVYWAMNPAATDVAKQSSPAVSPQTALLWSEIHEVELSAEVGLLVADIDPLSDESFVSDEEDFAAESEAAVPAWLLTAVSSRADSELESVDDSQSESNVPEDL